MNKKAPFVNLASLPSRPEIVGGKGMTRIGLVKTPRLLIWYRIYPATGNEDCKCVVMPAAE